MPFPFLSLGLATNACGGKDGGAGKRVDAPTNPDLELEGDYGIHIRVGDDARELVVPAMGQPISEEVRAQYESLSPSSPKGASVKKGDVRSKSQAVTIDDPSEWGGEAGGWDGLGYDPHWLLAWGAATQCEFVVMEETRALAENPTYTSPTYAIQGRNWFIADEPWGSSKVISPDAAGEGSIDANSWYFITAREHGGPLGVGTERHQTFRSCDEVLRAEQLVLCMANELDKVASSVGPVTWEGPGRAYIRSKAVDYSEIASELKQTWVIPPQRTRDRFIARDAALNALSHLARLSTMDPWRAVEIEGSIDGTADAKSCSAAWVDVLGASDPSVYDDRSTPLSMQVFGEKWFANGLIDQAEIAQLYLNIHSSTMRTGGLLLKKLIDDSINADLAGAEMRRDRQTDHLRGLEALWGVDRKRASTAGPFIPTYNSIDHALSVLVGRREQGFSRGEGYAEEWKPTGGVTFDSGYVRCGGYRYDEQLDALGANYSAGKTAFKDGTAAISGRWAARDVRNQNQREAIALLASNGIVIRDGIITGPALGNTPLNPPSNSEREMAIATARTAIVEQVLLNMARERGLDNADSTWQLNPTVPVAEAPTFRDSATAQSAIRLVENISDGALSFGIQHLAAAYRLLTGAPRGADPWTGSGVSLLSGDDVAAELAAITTQLGADGSSIVIKGGFPFEDLRYDVFASTGQARANAECEMYVPDGDHPMEDHVGRNESFQNVFMTGDIMRRNLAAIGERVRALGNIEHRQLARNAELAAESLRAWTGPGRIWIEKHETMDPLNAEDPNGRPWAVHLTGYTLGDFGVDESNPAGLADRLKVVYGPPWYADCAAGLRSACVFGPQWQAVCQSGAADPDGLQDCSLTPSEEDNKAKVLDPVSITKNAAALGAPVGISGDIISLQFASLDAHRKHFDDAPSTYLYHLVASTVNGGPGRVLASFLPKSVVWSEHNRWDTMVVSDYQRQQLNRILGMGDQLGEPEKYPLDIERLPFVPLESELTSDSDGFETSWRHYLELARRAAVKADELGREIIQEGRDKDFRAEAAGEEIANLCGSYGALDRHNVVDGELQIDEADEALKACLGEDAYTLTAVSERPPELNGNDPDAVQQEYLGNYCDDPDNNDEVCDDENFTYASLGLVDYPVTDANGAPVTPDGCIETALGLLQSHRARDGISSGAIAGLGTHPHIESGSLSAVLAPARLFAQFTSTGEFHFTLFYDNEILISTLPNATGIGNVWPQECRPLGLAPPDPPGCHLESRFAAIFADSNGNPPPISTNIEREKLFERVATVLWRLGGLSGYLPDQTITAPTMLVNFSTADGSGRHSSAAREVPVLIYGHGRMNPDDSVPSDLGYQLHPNTGAGDYFNETDRLTLGFARAYPGTYLRDLANSNYQPRSQWLREVYERAADEVDADGAHRYLYTMASNTGRRFESWSKDPATFLNGLSTTGCTSSTWDGTLGGTVSNRLRQLHMNGAPSKLCSPPTKQTSLRASSVEVSVSDTMQYKVSNKYTNCNEFLPSGSKSGQCILHGAHWDDSWEPSLELIGPRPGHGDIFSRVFSGVAVDRYSPNGVAETQTIGGSSNNPDIRPTSRFLAPSACGPHQRMQVFAGSTNEYGECAGIEAILETLAFACVMRTEKAHAPGFGPVPVISDRKDISRLRTWLSAQEEVFKVRLSKVAFEGLPKRVVSDIKLGEATSGEIAANHGQLIVDLEAAIRGFAGDITTIGGYFTQIADAMEGTEIALAGNDIDKDIRLKRLSMERLDQIARAAQAVAQIVEGLAQTGSVIQIVGTNGNSLVAGSAKAAAGATELGVAIAQMNNIGALEGLEESAAANKVAAHLQGLSSTINPIFTEIEKTVQTLRTSQSQILAIQAQLKDQANEATYLLAKGAGAPFVELPNGTIVDLPVNVVSNRVFDIANNRYVRAVENAKELAYYARLAIEQRIGLRLNHIEKPVGPLEAPSSWADELLDFQGIDYSELRTLAPDESGDGTADQFSFVVDDEFTSPYLGDYVDRLESFVEYYNIEYPSHEGDDVAVLSLRDDLMVSTGLCEEPGPNLLYFSDALGSGVSIGEEDPNLDDEDVPPIFVRGWRTNRCDDDFCLQTDSIPESDGMSPNVFPPEEAGSGGVTWLHDVSNDDFDPEAPFDGENPRTVFQEVELTAGTEYVLSWWDTSLDDQGAPAVATTGYSVVVYDQNWQVLGGSFPTAHSGSDLQADAEWSARHELAVTPELGGTHYIAFSAGVEGVAGSVGIANVQLERTLDGRATTYAATDVSVNVLTGDCLRGDPKAFQDHFDYRCEGNDCFYELNQAIVIDTEAITNDAHSRLHGKIAKGNFNFRHVDVALNAVGNGILDCENADNEACYGTGYIEYSLEHSAERIPILTYEDTGNLFNFGTGNIFRGKALASERYVTLPIGSADASLLAQPQTTKPEFTGRPLSGAYKIRIHDSDALSWGRLEDIQLILTYRYWSKILPGQ